MTPRRQQRGFTLTEVLVALIVIAIGTLGIAKMQAVALSSTGASRSRALASIEASSLAAAMHANRSYWAGSPDPLTSFSTTVGSTTPTLTASTGTLGTALTSAAGSSVSCGMTAATLSCFCNGTSCRTAAVNMAANDLYDWGAGLASLLPSASGSVACNTTDSPVDCTITIQWVENAVAVNSAENAANSNANTSAATTAGFQYVTYSLVVVP